ncbi:MAG: GNAT family N-acetyltransferase [Chitinophagaceae bacterium]|nr:GNAT family N-acetyltransferase [Chitinophagaceae bacterium]
MTIEKYNIKLIRLSEKYIEDMRKWRNSDYVRSQMLYEDYITSNMQLNWYNNLDKTKNFYFIGFKNDAPLGVIHLKNIENNRGEGGIFLIGPEFENTDIVAKMVICFNDYIFYDLKIECIYSHVKATNKKAISSSISQGCVKNESKSTEEIVYFELFPNNYEKKTHKIKKILQNG